MLSKNPILPREEFYRDYTSIIGLQFTEYSYVVSNYESAINDIISYLENAGPFHTETYSYEFVDVRIEMMPSHYDECLINGTMYGIVMKGDMIINQKDIKRNITIIKLPRMIGSYIAQGYVHSGNEENPIISNGYFVIVGGNNLSKVYVLNKWEMLWKGRPITFKKKKNNRMITICDLTSNNPITYDTGKVRISYDKLLTVNIGRKMSYLDAKSDEINFMAYHIFWALVSQLVIFLEQNDNIERFKIWINQQVDNEDMSILQIYKFALHQTKNKPFSDDKKYLFSSLDPPVIAEKFINQINSISTKSITYVIINNCLNEKLNPEDIDSIIYDIPIRFGWEQGKRKGKKGIKRATEEVSSNPAKSIIDKLYKYDHAFSKVYFPHIMDNDKRSEMNKKFILVSEMVYRVENDIIDDRDHMGNKFFDTPGNIIKTTVIKGIINNKFKKNSSIIYEDIQEMILRNFRTGSWAATKSKLGKVRDGASEIAYPENFKDRYNFGKNCVSRNKNGPMVDAGRGTHPSQVGYKCKSHTPEGKQVGLLTFDSLHTRISSDLDSQFSPSARKTSLGFATTQELKEMLNWISNHQYKQGNPRAYAMYNDILISFINADDMDKFISHMRHLRREGILNTDSGISSHIDDKIRKVEIRTGAGRPLIPLFIVENGKIKAEEYIRKNYDMPSLDDLVEKQYVEWIDPREMMNLHGSVLESPSHILEGNFTHCIMDPSFYLSFALAVGTLFPENTAAQRFTYASSLLGAMRNPYKERKGVESKSDVIFGDDNEAPIIENVITRSWNLSGRNALMAYMVMIRNTEDAVIAGKEYMDNMNIISFDHIEVSINNMLHEVEFEGKKIKFSDLAKKFKLEPNGILKEGEILTKGKILNLNVDDRGIARVEKYHKSFNSMINKIINSGKEGLSNVYRIEIKISLPMMTGDKVTTLHGQKGVLADHIKTEDMYYDPLSGESIQVIANPLGLIGRLTPSQMKEGIIARAFPSGRTHRIGDLISSVDDFYIPCVMIDPYYKEWTDKQILLLERYGMKKGKLHIDMRIYRIEFKETQGKVDYVLYSQLSEKVKRFFLRKHINSRLPHALIKREDQMMPESLISLRISAFQNTSTIENEALERLKEMGYPDGKTQLINPMTGQPLDNLIYVGVNYQVPLKQRAALRFRIAATASINPNTGEFVKGSKKNGGFKFGKMEFAEFEVLKIDHIIKQKMETDKMKYKAMTCKMCNSISYIDYTNQKCGCGSNILEEREYPAFTIRWNILSFGAGLGLSFARSQSNTL